MNESNFEDPSFCIAKIGGTFFTLEICKDFEKGLSGRRHLYEKEGMLFSFPKKSAVSFHMKGCLIPLDIILVSDGIIKKIFHNCSPCDSFNCDKFNGDSIDHVIELEGGSCKKNSIKEGLIYKLI